MSELRCRHPINSERSTPSLEDRPRRQRNIGCAACVSKLYGTFQPDPQPPRTAWAEPQNFFANERTFLHWLSSSVILGMLSLSILRTAALSSSIAARWGSALLFLVAVGFMLFSLVLYGIRTKKIQDDEELEPDKWTGKYAPLVLVMALAISFMLVLLIRVSAI
eukprot:TRINITY_DN95948_c0_g1_i1.p1 TRINITY_DN95948_c0_g1~~TRINITY_DN95948_c0_g1_i1.p1  ORF type:complete len:164 (+),score=15.55 TRINITY_DN95948_c0_g1_i1:22-513(+)